MEEIIMREREFKEKLMQIINESQLPAFILKLEIKELFEQIIVLEQQQYEKAYEVRESKKMQQLKEEKDGKD